MRGLGRGEGKGGEMGEPIEKLLMLLFCPLVINLMIICQQDNYQGLPLPFSSPLLRTLALFHPSPPEPVQRLLIYLGIHALSTLLSFPCVNLLIGTSSPM